MIRIFVFPSPMRVLGLFSLKKGRLWGAITGAFQYLDADKLLSWACSNTRGSGLKVSEGRFRVDIRIHL